MIRVVVCDDDVSMLNLVSDNISFELDNLKTEYELNKFTNGNDLLSAHKDNPYDVVFLDIMMPEMGGFDVATEIRKLSEKTYLVFITTENALVYDSFNFQPFDFIPKFPPTELHIADASEFLSQRLSNVISRLLEQITAKTTVCLTLSYNKKIVVNISDIQLIQSVRNYAEYILTDNEPIKIRAKLDEIQSELNRHIFARPHKSYIVNMSYIRNINSSDMLIELKSGMLIPISKAYKTDFESSYLHYLSN